MITVDCIENACGDLQCALIDIIENDCSDEYYYDRASEILKRLGAMLDELSDCDSHDK